MMAGTTKAPRGTNIVASATVSAAIEALDAIPAQSRLAVAKAVLPKLKEQILSFAKGSGSKPAPGTTKKPGVKKPAKGGRKSLKTKATTKRTTKRATSQRGTVRRGRPRKTETMTATAPIASTEDSMPTTAI